MAQKDDGDDKTEAPTPKRLRDARKRGQVAKSKDVTSTVELVGWTLLAALASAYIAERLAHLFDLSFAVMTAPTAIAMGGLGADAFEVFIVITALLFIPVAALGLLAEFAQAGPIFTFERMKPTVDHMNPAEGLKRMFSLDNLVETLKVAIKTILLFAITGVLIVGALPQVVLLMNADPAAQAGALRQLSLWLLGWTIMVFVLVSVLDASYQRFSFLKRMRMSRRDIRDEHKDMEGDPTVRGRRRQLHQEWTQSQSAAAAREASLVVVNPTHLAIAIRYDAETMAPPLVTAKGEGAEARAMRAAAEEAEVPVVENVSLARALHERAEINEAIPGDMFDAAAEAIVWAQKLRAERATRAGDAS